MKKLIALVLLIVIPLGIIFLESSKEPLLKRVEVDGYSKQPKDSLWEYVKYEVGKGKVNLKIKYRETYKDPILFSLKSATPSDSLAVESLMSELKLIFPLKEVAYYSDFTGKPYKKFDRYSKSYSEKNPQLSDFNQLDDELVSFTTELSFGHPSSYTSTVGSGLSLGNYGADNIEARNNKWNKFFFGNEIFFGFTDDITVENKMEFIGYHFLKVLWKTHTENFIGSRSDFRRQQSHFTENYRPITFELADTDYLENHKFLLTKLFSNDFKKQFENYMYKTYPWRYANVFLNKKATNNKSLALVLLIGLMISILMLSYFYDRKFKYSFLNYFYPILLIWFHYFNLQYIYQHLTDLNTIFSLKETILSYAIGVPIISLITAFIIWFLEKVFIKEFVHAGYQILLKVIFTFLAFSLPVVILLYGIVIINFGGGWKNFQDIVIPELFLIVAIPIGRGLLLYLNHNLDAKLKEKDLELSRLRELKTNAELKSLQSQINPHFLYNALNSIASLAPVDRVKTQKMAHSLSDLFKYTINRNGKKMSTVSDEVTMVQNYLDIEKIRFGDRLQFSIDVDSELEKNEIPLFIIQPLVENAVKHGISKIEGIGEIVLKIEKTTIGILISVKDNGPNFPEGLVSGHGLQTVFDLLRLTYGDKASLNWQNKPEKSITVNITQNA